MFNKTLLVALFCVTSLIAQTPFFSIPNDLKTRNRDPLKSFAVVDEENNSFAIFLDDDKTLIGYLYSDNLELKGKFSSKGLPPIYTEIIGQTLKNAQIRLFLKNENNKNFGSVLFDFERKATITTEFGFSLSQEIYLQAYSYRDKFYILTVSKKSSVLNIYTFNHDGKFGKKSFDFSEETFRDDKNEPTRLDKLLTEYTRSLRSETTVVKMIETNPNPISISSKGCKIYDRGNKFVLSIDKGVLYTYLFEFTLPELTVSLKSIQKKQLPNDGSPVKNNSYLLGDTIFQIAANNNQLLFTIKNIETDEEIKQFHLSKEEEITFKNSPILQEGTALAAGERRELDETSQFLRKISDEDIGIAVLPIKKGYKITIGGNKELNVNTGGAFAGPNIIVGSPNVGSLGSGEYNFFNPIFTAYNSYKYNKSTRIECFFDPNFEHVQGIIPQNVFDKIRIYTLRNPNGKAENVFKWKDSLIYGRYNSKEDTYDLFKFSE